MKKNEILREIIECRTELSKILKEFKEVDDKIDNLIVKSRELGEKYENIQKEIRDSFERKDVNSYDVQLLQEEAEGIHEGMLSIPKEVKICRAKLSELAESYGEYEDRIKEIVEEHKDVLSSTNIERNGEKYKLVIDINKLPITERVHAEKKGAIIATKVERPTVLEEYNAEGKLEAVVTAKVGDYIVFKANNEGGRVLGIGGKPISWIMDAETYKLKYEPQSDSTVECFSKPVGGEQTFARVDRPIALIVSWANDGIQTLEAGSYINITNPDDVYGVNSKDFKDTYDINKIEDVKLNELEKKLTEVSNEIFSKTKAAKETGDTSLLDFKDATNKLCEIKQEYERCEKYIDGSNKPFEATGKIISSKLSFEHSLDFNERRIPDFDKKYKEFLSSEKENDNFDKLDDNER